MGRHSNPGLFALAIPAQELTASRNRAALAFPYHRFMPQEGNPFNRSIPHL
jgi:hypothetical protein